MAGIHVFLDCESKRRGIPGKPTWYDTELRCWAASAVRMVKGQVTKRWEADGIDGQQFWAWVAERTSSRYETYVWGHNVKCDLQWSGFWRECDAGRIVRKITICEDYPVIIRATNARGKIVVLDSMNWFRCPLDDVGRWVGKPKWTMPRDDDPDTDWLAYCRNDVAILEAAILRLETWLRENRLGRMAWTLPKQSFRAWNRHWTGGRIVPHGKPEATEIERKAYYGGRCEVRFQGIVSRFPVPNDVTKAWGVVPPPRLLGTSVHVVDIRSFYPSVMLTLQVPVRLREVLERPSMNTLKRYMRNDAVIGHVLINSKRTAYPLRRNGYTTYPTGRFWTVLCGPELEQAIGRGEVEAIGQTAFYDRKPIFASFVRDIWPLRKAALDAGDRVGEKLVKLLLNSCYGVWGQLWQGWEDAPDHPPFRAVDDSGKPLAWTRGIVDDDGYLRWGSWVECSTRTQEATQYRVLAGQVQRKRVKGEHPRAFPAIAAYVTSAGRVALQRLLDHVPGKAVVYVDTDSLHVTDEGWLALQHAGVYLGDVLGGLTYEGPYDYAEYVQRKAYRLGHDWTIAGRKHDSPDVKGFTYDCMIWQSFQDQIEHGMDGTIRIHEVRGTLQTEYRGGVVSSDGWVTPNVIGCR